MVSSAPKSKSVPAPVAAPATASRLGMLESIIGRFHGCLYRCRFDPEFTMVYLSASVERWLGYPPKAFLNNAERSFASIIHPEDADRVDAAINQAVKDRTEWSLDYRLLHRDGHALWSHETGGPVFGPDGTVAYLEGALIGIEDRKEQEIAREKTLAEIRRCGAGIGSTGRDILQLLRSLNLVAVNASIEASRAGAMGAGFAVVAEEVKRLADESRDSVNRILEFMEALEKVTGERSQLRL